MAANASQSRKGGSFCDARQLNSSERASMERASLEAHREFEVLLKDRPRYVDRKGRKLVVTAA